VASSAGNLKAGDPGIPAVGAFPAVASNDPLISSAKMVEKGYFEVKLSDNAAGNNIVRTGGTVANEEAAIRINAVNEAINISYCYKLGAGTLGACRLSPVNHAGPPAPAPGVGLPRPAPAAAAINGTHTITDAVSIPAKMISTS